MNSLNKLKCFNQIRSFYTFNPAIGNVTKTILDDGSVLSLKTNINTVKSHEQLPPLVRSYPQITKLTSEQIKEIKELRRTDPDTNTVLQLAKRYNTFPGFIMRITQCPKERRLRLEKRAEETFDALSISRKKTVIDRVRRKALW